MATGRYQSFLLKLWMRGEAPAVGLLLLLENTRTGEQHSFTCLDDLFAYLGDLTAPADEPPDARAPSGDR